MGITYNAVTHEITVDDYAAGAAATPADIYAASNGAGWTDADGNPAVLEHRANLLYEFGNDVKVIIASGSTTYVDISNCHIHFYEPYAAANDVCFYINASGYLIGDSFSAFVDSSYGGFGNFSRTPNYLNGTYQFSNFKISTNKATSHRLTLFGKSDSFLLDGLISGGLGWTTFNATAERLTIENDTSYPLLNVKGDIQDIKVKSTYLRLIYLSFTYVGDLINVQCQTAYTYLGYGLSNLAQDFYYTDCDFITWTHYWQGVASNSGYRRYTFQVHVNDKAGASLPGVSVVCEDKDGNTVFSLTTDGVGDAGGSTTYVNHTRFDDAGGAGAGVEYAYNPHKFTISKSGYETIVMDNVTVDSAIDWLLELQDAVVYPMERDVRRNVAYGPGGSKRGALRPGGGTFNMPKPPDDAEVVKLIQVFVENGLL